MERYNTGEKRKSKRLQASTSKNSYSFEMADSEMPEELADETIGYILSHTPPIVEKILEDLPAHVLNECAHVCRLWRNIVRTIKRRRTDIFWMFKVNASKNDGHVNPEDQKQAVYAAKDKQDIGDHFHQTLQKVSSEPKLGIMFCVDVFSGKPKKYFRNYAFAAVNSSSQKSIKIKKKKLSADGNSDRLSYHTPLMEYIAKLLPSRCSMTCCVATGLVGTPVDFSGPIELERSGGLASVFFPTIPGIETFQFSITDTDSDAFCEFGRRHRPPPVDADAVCAITGIPKDKDVKCLLVFLKDLPQAGGLTRSVLEHFLKKQKFKIALGGAFVDQVIAPMKRDDESQQIAIGVAFAGENLKAASLILEPSIRKPQKVLEKLNELKACNFPEKNCVAFMFSCCGRGTSFYGRPNVEAETFRKVFPTVPLFGLFGNGEIGINYLPDINMESKKPYFTKDSSRPHWFHGYTTIFILLSWSKI